MKKIISALLISTLFACTNNTGNTQSSSAPSTEPMVSASIASIAPTSSSESTIPASVAPSSVASPAAFKFDPNKEYNVLMETTMGTIKIKLYNKVAPKTVENFVTLASRKYYDGIIFHRVINDFMIQGGDPTGNGTGGESAWGGKFEDEFSTDVKFDKTGLLAMANSGPASNGSQFFITLSVPNTEHLHMKHTIFGEVIEGMDVVKAIGNTGVAGGQKPIVDVVMKKVTVL